MRLSKLTESDFFLPFTKGKTNSSKLMFAIHPTESNFYPCISIRGLK